MPRLRDALKRKFKSPQEALRALGLDETLIEQEQNNMTKALLSRKAAVAKGALMAVLRPVLAADANLNLNAALKHLTVKNFADEKQGIARAVYNVASKKLAKDQKLALDEVEKAMDVAEKDDEPEAKDEKEEKEEKKAKDGMLPGKAALDKFLKEKMSEDDYKAACDMMEEAEDSEETEEEKKKKAEDAKEMEEKKKAEDKKAKDSKMMKDKKARDEKGEEKVEEEEGEEKITKGAMDAALASHGKKIRETERAIRMAMDQVRPIIGDLRADLAFDSATDVFRHAASALEIKGAKTMHADALWPVIEMHAKMKDRPVQRQNVEVLGFDEASINAAVEIAPGLKRIRMV